MKLIILLFAIFCISKISCYTAGVFEHYPLTTGTPENIILTNLNSYRSYATTARQQQSEILVFPEYGLTGIVTDPTEYAIDLDDTSNKITTELKDIAIELQIYLVVNLLEKEEKPNVKTKYYNTNLVYDRSGNLILKYRKINLFQEPNLTPGDANQTLTFTTSFGVTFGIFTCFDILFENPAQRVLENSAVTDIVYPTAWIATMPFFTALSVQHGYALANGVNLLAANYGKPKEGHGGSGIYLANGKIPEMYISDSASSKRIIQNVTKISTRIDKTVCPTVTPFGLPDDLDRNNVTYFTTIKQFRASDYNFQNVDLTQKTQTLKVCHNNLCCTFDITINLDETSTTNKYKVAAFDGIADVESSDYHLQVCSLVACKDDSNDSCGDKLDKTGVTFTKLKVKTNIKREELSWYRPATLDAFLLPLPNTVFCNNPNATDSNYVELTTLKRASDVLVFGIIGKSVSSGSALQTFGILFLLIITLIKNIVV